MSEQKKFIDGLFFNLPHEKAPDFIKGSISISKQKFLSWLDQQTTNEKGYIKIDLKVSKDGKGYTQVNDWQPSNQSQVENNNEEIKVEEMPW